LTIRKESSKTMVKMPMRVASEFITALLVIGVS